MIYELTSGKCHLRFCISGCAKYRKILLDLSHSSKSLPDLSCWSRSDLWCIKGHPEELAYPPKTGYTNFREATQHSGGYRMLPRMTANALFYTLFTRLLHLERFYGEPTNRDQRKR